MHSLHILALPAKLINDTVMTTLATEDPATSGRTFRLWPSGRWTYSPEAGVEEVGIQPHQVPPRIKNSIDNFRRDLRIIGLFGPRNIKTQQSIPRDYHPDERGQP